MKIIRLAQRQKWSDVFRLLGRMNCHDCTELLAQYDAPAEQTNHIGELRQRVLEVLKSKHLVVGRRRSPKRTTHNPYLVSFLGNASLANPTVAWRYLRALNKHVDNPNVRAAWELAHEATLEELLWLAQALRADLMRDYQVKVIHAVGDVVPFNSNYHTSWQPMQHGDLVKIYEPGLESPHFFKAPAGERYAA